MAAAKRKILVVEDDQPMAHALELKLSHAEFTVLKAENGKVGLEVALREHPELILLDLLMPVMDGMTMLKKLREENEWGKNVPVIILTNLTGADDERNANVSKMNPAYYLVKTDWKIDDVLQKVKERLTAPKSPSR